MGNLNEKTKKNWERGLLTLMTGTALTIGCHRADTSSMSGSSLPEATARYNAGDGYDLLTGEIKGSCLNEFQPNEFQADPYNAVIDTTDVVTSREDLARKLGMEANAEMSAIASSVPKVSLKASILRDAKFSKKNITLLWRFEHSSQQVYSPTAEVRFKPEVERWLRQKEKIRFRENCGDRYIDSVTLGASLYLVFSVEAVSHDSIDVNKMSSEIEGSFKGLFSAKKGTSIDSEKKKTLENLRISTSCRSSGLSATPCSINDLSVIGMELTDETIARLNSAISKARDTVREEVNAGKNRVEISRTYRPYPVPSELGDHSTAFFGVAPYYERLQSWLKIEGEKNEICALSEVTKGECDRLSDVFKKAFFSCSQNHVLVSYCSAPPANLLGKLKEIAKSGPLMLDKNLFKKELENIGYKAHKAPEFVELVVDKAWNLSSEMAKRTGVLPYNIMVHYTKLVTDDSGINGKIFDDKIWFKGREYRVIVFESGWFENKGDGAYLNWGWYGCTKDQPGSKTVNFDRCQKY
jgi:hypothetical protein